ncbi:MAG: hypothetical protein HY841_03990 [Bacteroidetes bacterium]|nr:hypothetical protein [Bacteroidota bacterium]
MQAKKERYICEGKEYDKLFPKPNLTEKTVKRGATVDDTVKFIPKVVQETKWQTEKIAEQLKGETVYETCRNIWEFIYTHVRYHKNEAGLEQVRSPARLWHDRFRGVDCDCYTVTICGLLLNCDVDIGSIVLRITKYKNNYFQHIYPVVRTENPADSGTGFNYITLDCVVDKFDYEEPYTEKQDTKMDLHYLDGFSETQLQEPYDGDDFDGLGKKGKAKGKGKGFFKKVLHATNKLNPATVMLRNGILASMKLNIFKIAQRIKWAYASEAELQKQGGDISKWKKLVTIKDKLEKIFYGAGGKQENLKKAILTGKGNKNKEVAGLFGYMPEGTVFEMNERTPLPQLIGEDIYTSENVEGMEGFEGFGELGEPVTAATIASATGVLAAIAGLLKGIGNIFPKKEKGSEDFENTEKEDAAVAEQAQHLPASKSDDTALTIEEDGTDSSTNKKEVAKTDGSGEDSGDGSKPKGFWANNKKWLKPTLWGIGGVIGLSLLYAGYRYVTKPKKNTSPQPALSGLKGKKKKHDSKDKKKNVELV